MIGMSGMGGGGMKGPGGMSSMRADGSDLSLGGHKDLILSELKHLTDESMHLNRGGGGGGGDMKMKGG